jgi:hypothetical protein
MNMGTWLNKNQGIGEGAMNAERRNFRLKKQYGTSLKKPKKTEYCLIFNTRHNDPISEDNYYKE